MEDQGISLPIIGKGWKNRRLNLLVVLYRIDLLLRLEVEMNDLVYYFTNVQSLAISWEDDGEVARSVELLQFASLATANGVVPTEPCIQGHNDSGSVFFSGCNLRCVFCQNHDIAHQRNGQDLTPEELGNWYIKLQNVGHVHNINLVTPEHVVPQVVLSILHARELGLNVPIVYNTSAFDSLESIKLLDGLVDIYLPDFKVWKDATSSRLLKVPNYTETAMESIKAMQDQVGDL